MKKAEAVVVCTIEIVDLVSLMIKGMIDPDDQVDLNKLSEMIKRGEAPSDFNEEVMAGLFHGAELIIKHIDKTIFSSFEKSGILVDRINMDSLQKGKLN